jgi:hypothetical protein
LRSPFKENGRANSELANTWKIEGEIESSKETRGWISVGDRIERRRKEGKARLQEQGRNPTQNDEISYLTVDCDFQEVDVTLPERSRRKSPERGYYYETSNSKEPIEGPKTQEEIEEENRLEACQEPYLEQYKKHKIGETPIQKEQKKKTWTPRQVDIEEEEEGSIPVKVQILERSEILD